MRLISSVALLLFSTLGARLSVAVDSSSPHAAAVRLNSTGYMPESEKLATVGGNAKEFVVRDIKTNAEVIDGRLLRIEGSAKDSPLLVADFSALKSEGACEIKIRGDSESSVKFLVGKDVYNWPLYCVFRGMYLWRCGTEVSTEVAGRRYEHAACHLDDAFLDRRMA
jgi:endoglucanase